MIEITKDLNNYYHMFDFYPVFHNFLVYAIRDLSPKIFVDQVIRPNVVVLHSYPAYFILGEPNQDIASDVISLFHEDSWIIADSLNWKNMFESMLGKHVVSHERTLFDSTNLSMDKILSYRKTLPAGLSIVPIDSKHLIDGMIADDVVSRFFTVSPFEKHGFGFALVDLHDNVHGFALSNYPVIGSEVELYVRVGYEYDPMFRMKGIGTTLCSYFIEESLHRGLTPIWDAAHVQSAHMAKKLGYTEKMNWFMYHILHH